MTTEQRPQDRYFEILTAVVAVLVFGYTCLRAFRLSITFDEATTYLVFARGPWAVIWNCGDVGIVLANNHLLNTILVKFLVGIFGLSEWVLRIPALIGHLLYLLGIYKLLKLCFKGLFSPVSGLLFFTHPYLLDFFSLSRGYALSLGFVVWGLYYFLRWLRSTETGTGRGDLVMALVFIALSVISTFSFLSVYLGLVCVVLTYETGRLWIHRKQGHSFRSALKLFLLQTLIPVTIISFLLSSVIVKPMLTLAMENQLYLGGTTGFWQDTVSSLIFASEYGVPLLHLDSPLLCKYFLVISIGLYLILQLRGKQSRSSMGTPLRAVVLIMLFTALIINLQHVLLGVKFPIERTAIYFIPLFLIFVLLLWRSILDEMALMGKFCATSLFGVTTALFLLHNLLCFNLSHTMNWRFDASTREAMEYVYELSSHGQKTGRTSTLGVNWLLAPSIDFYIHKKKMSRVSWTRFRHEPWGVTWFDYLLDEERLDTPEWAFDFYYFPEEDRQFMVTTYHLWVIKTFDVSQTCLAIPCARSQTN